MEKKKEQVIQKFPHRCPYCDQIVSYEKMDLKSGENEIKCPWCNRKYIKVVLDLKRKMLTPKFKILKPKKSKNQTQKL